jgi:excisionase family DNA binding protein
MPREKQATSIIPKVMEQPASAIGIVPELLSRKQVAELLQIGMSTLDTRIPPEALPRLKLGKTVRFLRSDVETYLLQNRIERSQQGEIPIVG